MDDSEDKKGRRKKPTNEQREKDEYLKRFNEEIERKCIHVEDPAHPLRGLPDDRLRTAIMWAVEDGKELKGFLETFADIAGVGFSRTSLNGWFRESSKIPTDRLGFIVNMLAKYMSEERAGRLSSELDGEAQRLDPFMPMDGPTVQQRYDAAYSLIVDCLFGLAEHDRVNLKRLAVVAALMEAEEAEIDAVGAVLTCHIPPHLHSHDERHVKSAREVLIDVSEFAPSDSMTEVADGIANELFEAGALENVGELVEWAKEVRSFADERKEHEAVNFVDVPF